MALADDPIESFSEADGEDGHVDFATDGCSCVGLYAVCACGFLDGALRNPMMLGASFRNRLASTTAPIDLDSDGLDSPVLPAVDLARQAQQIQSQSPVLVPVAVAHRAASRFPGDLPRSISEACCLLCSPRRRSRSPSRLIPMPPLRVADKVAQFWLVVAMLLSVQFLTCILPTSLLMRTTLTLWLPCFRMASQCSHVILVSAMKWFLTMTWNCGASAHLKVNPLLGPSQMLGIVRWTW